MMQIEFEPEELNDLIEFLHQCLHYKIMEIMIQYPPGHKIAKEDMSPEINDIMKILKKLKSI